MKWVIAMNPLQARVSTAASLTGDGAGLEGAAEVFAVKNRLHGLCAYGQELTFYRNAI